MHGVHALNPFTEHVVAKVDLREQTLSLPPQSAVTSENYAVSIDTVIQYRIVDPIRLVYGIKNYVHGIEQLVSTTLRDLVGSMDVEHSLTSRDALNSRLRAVRGKVHKHDPVGAGCDESAQVTGEGRLPGANLRP